jgi:hypothetical protein
VIPPMARTTEFRCDICKKPTDRIVGKLHFVPMIPGVSRGVHSNYSHHADVGECCKDRLLKGFNFRKRLTADEYQAQRKNGNGTPTAKTK